MKGVERWRVQEKRAPIVATTRHKSHKDFLMLYVLFLAKLLWAKADAREDVCELAMRAEPRENGIDFQIHQPDVALLDCGLEPLERLLVIAKSSVYRGYRIR